MLPTHLMIFGAFLSVLPVAGSVPASAAINWARVETVYVCAAVAAEPPAVPPDCAAQPVSATAVAGSAAAGDGATVTALAWAEAATSAPPVRTAVATVRTRARREPGRFSFMGALRIGGWPGGARW